VALAVYQVYTGRQPRQAHGPTGWAFHCGTLVSRALTLSVVMVGWIFFGTETPAVAFTYLGRMVTWSRDGVALGSPFIVPLAALMLLAHLLISKDRNLIEEMATYSASVRVLAYASLLLALGCLVPGDGMPFAYVRF